MRCQIAQVPVLLLANDPLDDFSGSTHGPVREREREIGSVAQSGSALGCFGLANLGRPDDASAEAPSG
jgi:hypothetical protein